MQERIAPFIIDDSMIGDSQAALVEEDVSMLSDVEDVAEMVHGYVECMSEAVRYLTQVEHYPEHHPAVEALRAHLAHYRQRLVATALYSTAGLGFS